MASQKVQYDPSTVGMLLDFSPVLLVSAKYQEDVSIMTCTWSMPVSFSPPLIAIAVGHGAYTNSLIENSREFSLNVPTIDLLEAVKYCGSASGRDCDKYLETGLTELKPLRTAAPLISECFANIECQIHQSILLGDHTLYCGQVVSILAERDVFIDRSVVDTKKYPPIMYLGQESYFSVGDFL